jgi:dTDP-glucose 4,6-dehydratase
MILINLLNWQPKDRLKEYIANLNSNMKNVLITGGAGFISHHLIYYLIKNTNWNIVSLDRLDYSGNLNRLDNILSELSIEEKSRVKLYFMI